MKVYFFSPDNGNYWGTLNNGLTSTIIKSLAVSGSNIFAGTDKGVFLFTNNGNSWVEVNNGLGTVNVFSLIIDGSKIYAGTNGGVWQRPLSEMLGIENMSIDVHYKFYPNPSSDFINHRNISNPDRKPIIHFKPEWSRTHHPPNHPAQDTTGHIQPAKRGLFCAPDQRQDGGDGKNH